MRRRIVGGLGPLGVIGALCAALSAAGLVSQSGALLQELSISESEAHDGFFNGIWEGSSYVPGGQKTFKVASGERKAAIVRGLATLLKAYTRTPAFRTRYAEYWDANKPGTPKPAKSAADQNKETDDSIKKMEESIKTMPPDMRKQMEEMAAQMKAQQEAMRKDKQMQALMESAARQADQAATQRYETNLARYQADHPKDPDAMIALRLREFLTTSAGVDYQAKLVKSGGVMRFENEALENKSPEWKLCYRAGKDATDAARAFAAEWLKELEAR